MSSPTFSAVMDVYFVPSHVEGFSTAHVSVHESWDGSHYAEANVREFAGPSRHITQSRDGIARVDGMPSNGEIKFFGPE